MYATGSRRIKMAAGRKENDLNKQLFISTTMAPGLRRGFILQLCIFRLRCNIEEYSLHFGRISEVTIHRKLQFLGAATGSPYIIFITNSGSVTRYSCMQQEVGE
jgi:hypothetical protein